MLSRLPKGRGDVMSITTQDASVAIEECTQEQGQQMLEDAAQSRFGLSWADFFAAYEAGDYRDTDVARVAEELAFLSRFAG